MNVAEDRRPRVNNGVDSGSWPLRLQESIRCGISSHETEKHGGSVKWHRKEVRPA